MMGPNGRVRWIVWKEIKVFFSGHKYNGLPCPHIVIAFIILGQLK